jgi:uncharacterized protein (TIGR03435 family)
VKPVLAGRSYAISALLSAAFVLASSPVASAQATPTPPALAPNAPAYDILSIKRNNTASGNVDIDTDDARFTATNVSLKALLAQGYDIKQDLVSGITGPLDSARFDVEAKIVDPDPAAIKKLTRAQRRAMLLPLLKDRFQLQTHTEVKTLPVYELVVVKGGPRFKLSADQAKSGGMNTDGTRTQVKIYGTDVSMSALAKAISTRADRPVIDKTGLAGNFDINLQFSRETPDPDAGVSPDAPPVLFTAIQEQLGLKLQPAKGPVETLVVDHAVMPSEN